MRASDAKGAVAGIKEDGTGLRPRGSGAFSAKEDNMTKIESAVQWAINTANDNAQHGYEWGGWGPDYDCGHLIITAWEQAGVPVKSKGGASYTGNMRQAFIANGFTDVSVQVGLSSGYGMQRGDVLINYSSHAAMYVGDGKLVHARSSEGNTIPGDQSGNEIRVQPFFSYPWNCCLRYKGDNTVKEKEPSEGGSTASDGQKNSTAVEDHSWRPQLLQYSNSYKTDCVVLQALLNAHGWACGTADGFFGAKTQAAVFRAQAYYGLEKDGVCGPKTWEKLLEVGK